MNGKGENGQIAVLLVFLTIGLFGLAALVIDGGRIYHQRRAAQNAVDDAAMTAALAITHGYNQAQIEYIARERARENGFDHSEQWNTIEVYWPPQLSTPYAGDRNYVQVVITSEVDLTLARFVYRGDWKVTVQAFAHARVNEDIAPGFAALGNNLSACRTIQFDGSLTFDLTGGGSIGSNSTAGCNCDGNGGSGVKDGSGIVNVQDGGGIYVAGCWQNNGSAGNVSPNPIQNFRQRVLSDPPIPDCNGLPENGAIKINGEEILQPGVYQSMTFVANSWVTLEPGLYCINGTNEEGWGFEFGGQGTLQGDGVMLYFMDTSGGLSISGGAQVILSASAELKDASGNDWAGMLIYVHPSNSNEFILTGTSNSLYQGSVYAPGSMCTLQGTSGGVALQTQLICDKIRVTGTGDLDLNYDMSMNYHLPAAVELTW